ncbi:MAG TPA: FMN reductase [Frankiaceae bacterium]|nr:FMN reductase [Frankiaceae bacterium]
MNSRRLTVVNAGLSVPSSTRLLADRLSTAAAERLQEQGIDAQIDVIELRPLAHDLADNVLTGFPNAKLRSAVDAVVAADGLIAVTPIFRGSYSGLFKSFVDVLEPGAMQGKPVLIGATAGTARHSLALDHALRPLFTYLRSVVVPTGVFAAPEDWAGADAAGRSLAERIRRAADELAGLMTARPAPKPTDPFADVIPFEQLLRGQ